MSHISSITQVFVFSTFLGGLSSFNVTCQNGMICTEILYAADECSLIILNPNPECICYIPDQCDRRPVYLANNCNKFYCISAMNTSTLPPTTTTSRATTSKTPDCESNDNTVSILILIASVIGCLLLVILHFQRLRDFTIDALMCIQSCVYNLCKCIYWPFAMCWRYVIDPIGMRIETPIRNWWENRNRDNETDADEERPIIK